MARALQILSGLCGLLWLSFGASGCVSRTSADPAIVGSYEKQVPIPGEAFSDITYLELHPNQTYRLGSGLLIYGPKDRRGSLDAETGTWRVEQGIVVLTRRSRSKAHAHDLNFRLRLATGPTGRELLPVVDEATEGYRRSHFVETKPSLLSTAGQR